ncbi:NAD dependent epimerase/dehydratase [Penicillium chrysogenum]|uniref:NAD dependent epimerase/dehydratase n=1 Tax=Penicillium chrysogenum TaxID=5076 RepID=A0ABQ8WEJ8_PENCH|nr:NAD dependent epimerase/dehydratase [Penicillium chrysogenum]KAJ5244844.1 NAD dependent epimerase/dehydratase [Penicillium chrysogenum]KAJ5264820.1 NAD dependent epimerase/dehydratase [Penicillium chrysogenum]KAJ5849286.1 NAD dependent epimerase/dehydratase [Penicillium rubens]
MLPNQIVLVSGASGFVATHVLDAFLSAGYSVPGTVRSEKTADKVLRTFPKYEVKLIFAIVSDIGKPNAFDVAVKGVDSIIHTASPAQFRVDDNERDLLAWQSVARITSSIPFKSTHRV